MNMSEVKRRSKTKYQVASDSLFADIEGGKHLRPSQACSFRAATESSSQGFYIILFYSF